MSGIRAGDMVHLTDRQALAFHIEACIEGTSVAKLRRRSLAEYADQLLADPQVAEIVRLAMLHRAREGIGRPPLRSVGVAEA